MASNVINNGKFYIVNLITQGGQYVAIIPDFWYFDESCYYPNKGGESAASKRKQPEHSWTHYKCNYRGEFESFKEAKRRLQKAVEFSDLNTASEADDDMYGRGKRTKRPRQVYSPAEDSSSEEESICDKDNSETLPPVPKNFASSFTKSLLQSNKNLQDSQSQIATSGFLTSTQYPEEQESQDINSLNGSPTQGQIEADDNNFGTLNLSGYNNNAAASPSVPEKSITPLLPVNSTAAKTYTTLLPPNRNPLPTDVLAHSPSLSPAHRTSPLAHVNRRFPSNMEHPSLPSRQSQLIQLPSQPKSNDSNDKEATFKHKVLRLLCQNLEKTAQLEAKMDMLIAKSNNNLSQSVMENDQSTLVDMSELPLKTRDDLVAYDKLLQTNVDQYLKLVRMVKQIGGVTLTDAVKRAWERVLSIEVRAVVNWSGKIRKDKPQKHKLEGMKVTKAIHEGICLTKEFAAVTEIAFRKETRTAVKHAAETIRNKRGILPQEDGSEDDE